MYLPMLGPNMNQLDLYLGGYTLNSLDLSKRKSLSAHYFTWRLFFCKSRHGLKKLKKCTIA
jgi:hypothetical protein